MNDSGIARQPDISIRLLRENDLAETDQVMRLAFGTFIGLPNPGAFMGDADYVFTRWTANPTAAFGAELNGHIIGSNFATNWGSVGFFGPLTVHPTLWNQGVGKLLMEPVIAVFDTWGIKHAGLYTFANSTKHVGFYQKFGFWPRFLTALMSKPVNSQSLVSRSSRFSEIPANEQAGCLNDCRVFTDTIFAGLDVNAEIKAVEAQKLGDTILLWGDTGLVGLAVCHYGTGTEAGSDSCYIKFGAVQTGADSDLNFTDLLGACEALATAQGLAKLNAGMNTARQAAYRQMINFGFRPNSQGVVMQKPNEPGYNRPEIYLIDDWR